MPLKKALRYLAWIIFTPIAFVLLYLAAAWGLSRIPVGGADKAAAEVTIYIKTNGVHTDLVLPVKTEDYDWNKELPVTNTTGKDTNVRFIGIGWGDKGFYLETPTWADLKFSTAFKAAFALSSAAIHATYYHDLKEGEDCRSISISRAQYRQLIRYITASLKTDTAGKPLFILTKAVYGATDAFYEAKGSYSLFHTCNTWTNNGLKHCGQKACLWTPFDKGIFYHYRR